MRLFLYLVSLAVFGLAGLTYIALELRDVAEIETYDAKNTEFRRTHVWYIQDNGRLLLEAGNPHNSWVADLTQPGKVRIFGQGIAGEYEVTKHDAISHTEIRQRIRAQYGWRDWWVSLIFDTSKSFMIEATRNDT